VQELFQKYNVQVLDKYAVQHSAQSIIENLTEAAETLARGKIPFLP